MSDRTGEPARASVLPFDAFLASIDRIGEATPVEDLDAPILMEGAARLQLLPTITARTVADLVSENPQWIRLLGLVVGLSQESLRVTLSHLFGTSTYRVASKHAIELVSALDSEYGLLDRLSADRGRTYDFGDILMARYASRATAGRAIGRGRLLEDAVEGAVRQVGLPHQMRTSFVGQGGRLAPCDLAIPAGGPDAMIVIGIKGFNSTGSKLTDARREIEEMALVRRARQVVYAVVDGRGWPNRRADLRAIHALWEHGEIDGLYTQGMLDGFRNDVAESAAILKVQRILGGVVDQRLIEDDGQP